MLRQRTGSPADLLAVGLGNPGEKYEATRHNVGVRAISILAARHGVRMKEAKQLRSKVAEARIDGLSLALATPLTYMNESGSAVAPLVRRYGITSLDRLVVVHDELDLSPGTVKVKQGGGTAGHNGLRSIQAHLGDLAFCRVRVGIGRPPGREHGAEYVLRAPNSKDRAVLEEAAELAADVVETILADGVTAAMNQFNGLPPAGS